jgi:hypothetical protein
MIPENDQISAVIIGNITGLDVDWDCNGQNDMIRALY